MWDLHSVGQGRRTEMGAAEEPIQDRLRGKRAAYVATGTNDVGQCDVSGWTDIGQPE